MRGHWWFDSGIAGLYFIANSLLGATNPDSDEPRWPDVSLEVTREGVLIDTADEGKLKAFLEACYEKLASTWWNQSTSQQMEKKELVLYDKERDEFYSGPKRMPTPVAGLSTSARSWRADGILYKDMDQSLRVRCDEFLEREKKILWTDNRKLIYAQPVCHPKLDILPQKGKIKVCSICGQHMVCGDVDQTTFPLFSSKNATFSFNSSYGTPDVICWECGMLGKFAVHAAQYKAASPYTHIMQLNSEDMEVLAKAHEWMGCASPLRGYDPATIYFSNFDDQKRKILQNARLPYEVLWGFYTAAYELLREHKKERQSQEEDFEDEEISLEKLEKTASLGVVLMSLETKGQTFVTKEIVQYNDTTYVFRLIDHLKREADRERKDKKVFFSADESASFLESLFKDFYVQLIPQKSFDPANGLYRNEILRKVFKKSSILLDVESFVLKKSLIVDYPYLERILFFTKLYEMVIHCRDVDNGEGSGMTKEQVETATKLGAQIVLSAKDILKDEKGNVDLKPVKGDLFALRKTRTVKDFLEQLNRLQFRYGIILNKEIVSGVMEEPDVDFEEFKAYCMISAMNVYNGTMRPHSVKQEKDV
jgi:hypothetical protein